MSVVEILIRAKDQTKKATDSASKNLKNIEKSSGQSANSINDQFGTAIRTLAGFAAAAGTAYIALKKTYDMAKEGAELQMVETRVDRLATSIGTTSDALMGDLREATRGMYSDAELMASATDFMALGLANTHDEAVRLSSVASALNMNMNQLVLTLTNQTTMRFDALGVSVAGFDEKVKALEATGMSANEAFNEAFLQQAEEQIERVGHAADTAAGDFQKLEAQIKNLADTTKKQVADVIGPAVGDLADGLEKSASYQDLLTEATEKGIISQEELGKMMKSNQWITGTYAGDIEYLNSAIENYESSLEAANLDVGYYSDMLAIAGESTVALKEDTIDLEQVTLDANLAMKKYTESLLFKIASEGLGQEEALALAETMGLVDENTMFAAEQVNILRQRYDEGLISAEQYREAVAALGLEIEGIQSKSVTVTVNTELNDPLNLKGWNPRDRTVTYTFNTAGNAPGEYTEQDQALGGFYQTNSPTSFRTSEYGQPETAIFVPHGKSIYDVASDREVASVMPKGEGGGGDTYNYNLTMPTSSNPADVAMAFDLMQAYGGV